MRMLVLAGALLVAPLSSPAGARQDIVIGHVTGAAAWDAIDLRVGAQAYFDFVNASGGVNGRRLRILSVDDRFGPVQTAALIAALNGKVSALLPVAGVDLDRMFDGNALDRVNFAIFATAVGTTPLRADPFGAPPRRNVFHFRTGDFDLPDLHDRRLPLVREFRDNFEKYSACMAAPSHRNLEGYISAKLIVEAIRRSGDGSPLGVIRGLEMLRAYDLGGYVVDFSPARHAGPVFVGLPMISASGELIY